MKKVLSIFSIIVFIAIPNQLIKAQTWLPSLAQGVDDATMSFVEAIIEFEGDVVITGEFSSVSGVPAAFVARWNGTSWEAMGTGLPAVGRTLAIYNGELYAGLDGLSISTLQKWNGTSWEASGPFTQPISTLYVDPVSNDFYAGGFFTSPGRFIAKLIGTTWTGLGNLPDGTSSFPGVKAISVYNNQLYVGGTFGNTTSTQYCAKYNGSSFVQVHTDQPSNVVNAFVQKDNKLYFGGAFSRVGPTGSPFTPSVIGWDGTNWVPLTSDNSGPIPSFGGVEDLVVYKNQIYATGNFSSIFNTTVVPNNIARYNDCSWKDLADGGAVIGLNNKGYCLAVIGNDLYVGGEFTQAASDANSKRIARWNNVIECPDPVCFPASPTITITANQTFGCIGSTFNFSADATNGGTSPVYTWKVDGNVVGSNSASFSSSSLSDGQTITCELISNDACMSNPNATSNPIQVSIVTQVTPAVTITADNTTFCIGSTVNFTAIPTFGGSTPSYQWQVNGANAGTNSANFSSSSFTNGDVVSCTLTSSESCANPTSATSNTVSLTVASSITPTISITGDPTICSGENVTFSSSVTGGGSSPSYQWKKNGTNVGSNSATFSTTSLANNDVIQCVLTSNDACAVPPTVSSNSITMVVTASATASINISASQTSICVGDNVTFSSSITNGGSSPSYQWQVNGVNVGSNAPTFSSNSLTNGQSVSCTLSSSQACTNDVTSAQITITVNSPTNPSISISANQNQICAGTNVTFTAVGSNAGTSPIYKWFHNNELVGTNSTSYSTTSLQNGDYVYCYLQSTSSCGGNATSDISNYVVMTVVTEATVGVQGTNLVSLTNGTSYQWVDCTSGENIPGATSATFTPSEAGAYKVVVQLNSCEVESQCYPIFVQASLAETTADIVVISPNPSSGIFQVNSNQAISYQVVDLKGSIIQANKFNDAFVIDLSKEVNGIYFLKISSGSNETTSYYKLVKN